MNHHTLKFAEKAPGLSCLAWHSQTLTAATMGALHEGTLPNSPHPGAPPPGVGPARRGTSPQNTYTVGQ